MVSCDPQIDEPVTCDLLERECFTTRSAKLTCVDWHLRTVYVDHMIKIDSIFYHDSDLPPLQERDEGDDADVPPQAAMNETERFLAPLPCNENPNRERNTAEWAHPSSSAHTQERVCSHKASG